MIDGLTDAIIFNIVYYGVRQHGFRMLDFHQ